MVIAGVPAQQNPALRSRQRRRTLIERRDVPASGTHSISIDDAVSKVSATAKHPQPGFRCDTTGLHVPAGDDAVDCIGNFVGNDTDRIASTSLASSQ
jgi:hypothetical protein